MSVSQYIPVYMNQPADYYLLAIISSLE